MMRMLVLRSLLIIALGCSSASAFAWGDEGHRVVALIGYHYLDPAVKVKVDALLKSDTSKLTAHDIASEATWADVYRDSDADSTKVHYDQTHYWHYANIQIAAPSIDQACYQHPPLPKGTVASRGPAQDCIVDKIDQFTTELRAPKTSKTERLAALKFLLHFVGDLHQPLHSSDDNDRGGNAKLVTANGIADGNLHHYWDTEFVFRLGNDPAALSRRLINAITPAQKTAWSAGTATDWANETFEASKVAAYGALPAPDSSGKYPLSPQYVEQATQVVKEQLSRAGVRLASLLNSALK